MLIRFKLCEPNLQHLFYFSRRGLNCKQGDAVGKTSGTLECGGPRVRVQTLRHFLMRESRLAGSRPSLTRNYATPYIR